MIERVPYSPDKLNSIVEFTKQHPWLPLWNQGAIWYFLSQLISSYNLVYDYFENGERIGTAVLLDRINNVGNHAHLEFLGMVRHHADDLIPKMIQAAAADMPHDKSGIGITFHSEFPHQQFVKHFKISENYQSFEMENHLIAFVQGDLSLPLATPEEAEQLYHGMAEAFAENPEFSMPSFEVWLKGHRAQRQLTGTIVVREENRIVGYATAKLLGQSTGLGEVATLGVLPAYRKRGLGKTLLHNSLIWLRDHGVTKCKLDVAAANAQALSLYENAGFSMRNHFYGYVLNS